MNKVFTAALLASAFAAGTALAQSTSNTTTTNNPTMGATNSATGSGMTTGSGTTTNSATGTSTSTGATASTTNNTSTTPPAIATPDVDSQTQAAPVPGANSFTESQARDRLEAHGYTNVTGLRLDDQQIWRGKATKNGAQVNVALDYQGNIVSQ
jgi:hypothetical protein